MCSTPGQGQFDSRGIADPPSTRGGPRRASVPVQSAGAGPGSDWLRFGPATRPIDTPMTQGEKTTPQHSTRNRFRRQGASKHNSSDRTGGFTNPLPLAVALIFAVIASLLAQRTGTLSFNSAVSGPFTMAKPTVTLRDGQLDVTTSITSEIDTELRGWFFLASPGEPQPWDSFIYQSERIEHSAATGNAVEFHWSEPLSLPNGLYELTFWFHRPVGDTWVHAYGGPAGIDPIVIDNDPPSTVHQFFGGAVASFDTVKVTYDSPELNVHADVTGSPGVTQATFSWELRSSDHSTDPASYIGAARPVTFGTGSGRTVAVTIKENLAVPAGTYDLWLTIDSGELGSQPQRAVLREIVVEPDEPLYMRSVSAAGPYVLSVDQPLPRLAAGKRTPIGVEVAGASDDATCQIEWRLSLSGQHEAVSGENRSCERATILLPKALEPGQYILTLTAVAVDDDSRATSDEISIPVKVSRSQSTSASDHAVARRWLRLSAGHP